MIVIGGGALVQSLRQPSKLLSLPSSHCSPVSTIVLPHTAGATCASGAATCASIAATCASIAAICASIAATCASIAVTCASALAACASMAAAAASEVPSVASIAAMCASALLIGDASGSAGGASAAARAASMSVAELPSIDAARASDSVLGLGEHADNAATTKIPTPRPQPIFSSIDMHDR